jgi:hypothetical protein
VGGESTGGVDPGSVWIIKPRCLVNHKQFLK